MEYDRRGRPIKPKAGAIVPSPGGKVQPYVQRINTQNIPGASSTRVKIGKPGIGALGKGNALVTGLSFLEGAMLGMDNPYGDMMRRQYEARESGDVMPRGFFADQIDAATKPFLDLILRNDAQPTRSRLPSLRTGDDIPLDQYPAGVPRPGSAGVAGARPSLTIPDSISETDKGEGPKSNRVGQDYDPVEPGMQGSGDPPGLPRSGGRDLSRPSLTYGDFSAVNERRFGISPGMYADTPDISNQPGVFFPENVESGTVTIGGKQYSVDKDDIGDVESDKMSFTPEKVADNTDDGAPQRGLSGLDAGSRAFLDYEGGSMGALRARDEALDLGYVEGNYYAIDRSKDPGSTESMVKLTEDQRRDITNRKSTAQDFLKSRIEGVKETQSEVPTPAVAQDPVVMPEGFAELSLEDKEAAFNKQREGVAENIFKDNPQGIENPTDAAMRDAIFLERKAKGLPF